jgi:hypothetical protein
MTADSHPHPRNRGHSLLAILGHAPTIVTVIGSAVLAVAASYVTFTQIQLLQAVIALLALIGTSLLTDKLIEGRGLRRQISEMDSRLTEALGYVHGLDSAGLDRLITHRRNLPPLEQRLEGARRVAISGGSLFRLANEYRACFEHLAETGCKLRFLLTDPDTGAAEALGSAVVYESDNVDAYRNQIRSAVTGFLGLQSRYPNICEVRLFAIAPSFSVVLVERENSASVLVEIYPFRVPARDRPMLMVDRQRDPELYSFFAKQYESMWSSSLTRAGAQVSQVHGLSDSSGPAL